MKRKKQNKARVVRCPYCGAVAVIRPASKPFHSTTLATLRMVPATGLEPVRAIHRTLIPARLPIPPRRHILYVKCGSDSVQRYQINTASF